MRLLIFEEGVVIDLKKDKVKSEFLVAQSFLGCGSIHNLLTDRPSKAGLYGFHHQSALDRTQIHTKKEDSR